MQVAVDGVVETLRAVPESLFGPGEVCRRLGGIAVDSRSLAPYLHFAPQRYTRNLIYRDALFELLALCWDPRSASPIHNHSGQLCWLFVERGTLRLENFHSLDGPGPGDRIRLTPKGGVPRAEVGSLDLQQGEDAIHRVSNPFEQRAVSLHVYSRPYDDCIAYDLSANTACRMPLWYHSVYGKLVEPRPEQRQ